MSLYAQQPARRTRQVLGDLAVLAWVVVWMLAGRAVHATISRLAGPGRTLENAGSSLEDGLSGAAEGVSGVPLVGDGLRGPLDAAGGAAASITTAGVELQETVAQTALVAGGLVAAGPALTVLLLWLWVRVRFVRRARAAQQLLDDEGGLELFALRALARASLRELRSVSPDPAGDWRRGDAAVVQALADLELRDVGVSRPR